MKKIILFLLAALVGLICQAEPLIYKLRLTVTRRGAGTAKKTNLSGFLVSDDNSARLTILAADAARKKFHRYTPGDFTGATIIGPRGTFAFIKIEGNDEFTGLRISGANTLKSLSDGSPIPRTLKLTGSDVFTLEDTIFRVEEYSGALTYDALKSKNFFTAGLDFELAVLSLQNDLLSKGFSSE